jgi:RimJ/RimL family protein N-acetyltransferase
VVADVDPRNAGSLGLLARLGFREAGRRKGSWLIGDELCDSVDLVLDAADWVSATIADSIPHPRPLPRAGGE